MVRFQCDGCGKIKEANEAWIVGSAAENIGVTSARREISIISVWDRSSAVNPLAVHFCSDQCRMNYTAALFGDSPETLQGEATVPKKRMQRRVPGAVVDTVVTEKPDTVISKRTPKPKQTA